MTWGRVNYDSDFSFLGEYSLYAQTGENILTHFSFKVCDDVNARNGVECLSITLSQVYLIAMIWLVELPTTYSFFTPAARYKLMKKEGSTHWLTLNELWTSVSSRSMTTQIFPTSLDFICGRSGLAGTCNWHFKDTGK